MTKEQAAAYRKLYEGLVARPAEQLRQLAVKQRNLLAGKLAYSRDTLGDVLSRWKQYVDAIEAVDFFIKEGDALTSSTDEKSRVERRRLYARAALRGNQAAAALDAEVSQGSTAFLLLSESVDVAADTATKIADKVGDVVDDVADSLQTTVLYVAGAAALGIVAYALAKGR